MNDPILTPNQIAAIESMANHEGWNGLTPDQLRLLLWCLFNYFVRRLPTSNEG